jgi:uncharacterized protein YdhG (YjbR/CyaY superfamily)
MRYIISCVRKTLKRAGNPNPTMPISVTTYIASQPAASQTILKRVRKIIRQTIPAAEEIISYKIPAYKLHGRPVLYFAGWKQHFSLYPATARVLAEFRDELSPYKISKGTIRFPLSQPVPAKLLARIAKFRAKEVAGRKKVTKSAKD